MVIPPRRRILFAAGAVALGLIGGLYAAEAMFRIGALAHSVPRTQGEFERIVATNWHRPVVPEKEPGTFRILGLADSFGVAGGERNYHVLLEQDLRARGYPVEVVNLSVGAYSIENELELLRRFGARYEPDLVLHGFFVGNDFATPRHRSAEFRGVNVDVQPGLASWYPQNLPLPQWTSRWRRAFQETERRARDEGPAQAGFSSGEFLRIQRTRISTCRVPTTDGPAWPRTTALLDAILTETRAMGADYVMVVHPDQLQVEPALAEEVVDAFALDRSAYDLDLPLKFLRAYGSTRRVPVIELAPAFRGDLSGASLYLPRDTHYADAGNRLAADVILETLEPMLDARSSAGF